MVKFEFFPGADKISDDVIGKYGFEGRNAVELGGGEAGMGDQANVDLGIVLEKVGVYVEVSFFHPIKINSNLFFQSTNLV